LWFGAGFILPKPQANRLPIASRHATFDYAAMRERIYIPNMIPNESIKTDAPFCYRDLDACLGRIDGLITVDKRFSVMAYLGQM
jgi:hypothetical protein